jgi:hypothetical protein
VTEGVALCDSVCVVEGVSDALWLGDELVVADSLALCEDVCEADWDGVLERVGVRVGVTAWDLVCEDVRVTLGDCEGVIACEGL